MQAKKILNFLREVEKNNNREWFQAHHDEYLEVKSDYESGIEKAIKRFSAFDNEISHLQTKDCTYRFYRDIRFSNDKSPYKNHMGAYICAKGKKALRGGYYIHIEPNRCMLAVGSYWLPTNILTACRNEIMGNIDAWRGIVESKEFVECFGRPNESIWEASEKGFGLSALKTAPKDFPRDYEFIQYIRMKEYCCWRHVSDDFFEGDAWLNEAAKVFKTAKPMMDFVNAVIDDYE